MAGNGYNQGAGRNDIDFFINQLRAQGPGQQSQNGMPAPPPNMFNMQQGGPAFFQQENGPRPVTHQQYPSFEQQQQLQQQQPQLPPGFQQSNNNSFLRQASFSGASGQQNTFNAPPKVSADSLFKRLNIDKQPDRATSFQFRTTPQAVNALPQPMRAASASQSVGNSAALLNLLNPRTQLPDMGRRGSKPIAAKEEENAAPAVPLPEMKPTPTATPPKDNMQALLESLKASSIKANSNDGSRPASIASNNAAKSLFTYTNPFEQLAAASPPDLPESQMPAGDVFGEQPKKASFTSGSPLAATPVSSVTPQVDESVKQTQKPATVDGVIIKPLIEEIASETAASPKLETPEIETPEPKSVVETPEPKTVVEGSAASRPQMLSPGSTRDGAESVIDDWENALADGTDEKPEIKTLVDVYSFPVKPFMSITIKPDTFARAEFKKDDNTVMQIARLKKNFDQNDRTLVTATKDYIVFAMSRNGGVRIIRQDSGKDKKVFEESQDPIFNISASVARDNGAEAIVATGCSGTVYWCMIKDTGGDRIEEFTPHFSFSLPPIQSPGDENPGGVLKTRARKSSNHTEFFAVGRGKSIHIIFPNIITKKGLYKPGTLRTVNVEKYLAYRTLKIDTGKAAKDFIFSQDDTTVVSLDKAGRVKFWDIRRLTSDEIPQSVELKEPLMSLTTTPSNEKSWPTSITFVDKVWPYVKNSALRYLIVGMKQNHTLQLWDLALKKVAQEIQLPHDKESDAACSVVYHKDTSMLVVGHPTRNSIYFIHLSFPKYDLPRGLSQADFISRIGTSSTDLSPKDTAIMRAIREYSFTDGEAPTDGSPDKRKRGDLRSLDILANPVNEHDPSILFEIFTMHSTGVTSIAIHPEDLGLTSKLADINAKSAEDEGCVDCVTIEQVPQPEKGSSAASTSSAFSSPVVQITPKIILTKDGARKALSPQTPDDTASLQSVITPLKKVDVGPTIVNGSQESATVTIEKSEKKKKRKAATGRAVEASVETGSPVQRASIVAAPAVESASDIAARALMQKKLDKVELAISALSKKVDSASIDTYQRFEKIHKEQAEAGDVKMAQILKLVEKTLTESVDKRLSKSFDDNAKLTITPALEKVVNATVQDSVAETLRKEIDGLLPKSVSLGLTSPQFTKQVASAVSRDFQQNVTKSLTEAISATVVSRVASVVEAQVTTAITTKIVPAIAGLTKENSILQQSMAALVAKSEVQNKNDNAKIEKLETAMVQMMSLLSDMADHQKTLQKKAEERENQLLAIIEQNKAQNGSLVLRSGQDESAPTSPRTSISRAPSQPQQQQRQAPAQEGEQNFSTPQEAWMFLTQQLAAQAYEAALSGWLSADDRLIDSVFGMRIQGFDSRLLFQVPPMVSLSVIRAVGLNLGSANGNLLAVENRISWLGAALHVARQINYSQIGAVSKGPPRTIRQVLIDTQDAKKIVAELVQGIQSELNGLIMREGSTFPQQLQQTILGALRECRSFHDDLLVE